jgi:outer membrane murein-binding lipoprotein Lpp
MSFDEILKLATLVLGCVNFLVTVGLWLYVRSSDRHEKIDQRFSELAKDLDTRMDKTAERLTALEADARRAPTHADMGRVYERINAVAETLGNLKGAVDQLRISVNQLMSKIVDKGLSA